jgi:hypothetical protein
MLLCARAQEGGGHWLREPCTWLQQCCDHALPDMLLGTSGRDARYGRVLKRGQGVRGGGLNSEGRYCHALSFGCGCCGCQRCAVSICWCMGASAQHAVLLTQLASLPRFLGCVYLLALWDVHAELDTACPCRCVCIPAGARHACAAASGVPLPRCGLCVPARPLGHPRRAGQSRTAGDGCAACCRDLQGPAEGRQGSEGLVRSGAVRGAHAIGP